MSVSNLQRRFTHAEQKSSNCSEIHLKNKNIRKIESPEENFDDAVKEVINESLRNKVKSTDDPSSIDALREEAKRLTESFRAATRRDNDNRKFNRNIRVKETTCLLLGLVCLICPVLITFDMLIAHVPMIDIGRLEFASQQNNRMGQISRACLFVIRTANDVREGNRVCGGKYVTGCIGALVLILIFLRHQGGHRATLSEDQRNKMSRLLATIHKELRKGKLSKDTMEYKTS